ncbi:MAG: ComEC/Rec2 family competence protein [Planctomycetota bacterium]|nr:MAG: ComEC/Rec2 family competence protein [Planctomycetota bacterium]
MKLASIPGAVPAAGMFLLACGWRVLHGQGPIWLAEGAALIAFLAALAAVIRPRGLWLCLAAAALGVARVPPRSGLHLYPEGAGLDSPASDSGRREWLLGHRPAKLVGRLQQSWRHGQGSTVAILDHLQSPQGRPLDRSDRSLRVLSRQTQLLGPPGSWYQVAGRLYQDRFFLHMEKARLRPVMFHPDHPWRPPPFWQRWRHWIRQRFHQVLSHPEAGMAQALILGESGAIPEGRYQAYRRLGLLHLLAVSGLHFWLWDALLKRFLGRRGRILRWPLLILMVILAGARAPAVRAVAFLFGRDWFRHRGGRAPGFHLWALALWVELALLDPRSANLGWVLSYGATAAMLAVPRKTKGRTLTLRLSLAAFLATAPWLHAIQGSLEPWSILLSPVLALALPWRLSLSLVSLLPGGPWLAKPALSLLGTLEGEILAWLQELPGSPWPLTAWSSLWLAAGCWVALGCLCRSDKQDRDRFSQTEKGGLSFPDPQAWIRRRRRWMGWGLAGILLLLATPGRQGAGVLALPVGHGLAVLIGGENEVFAFDAGSSDLKPHYLMDRVFAPELRRRQWRWPKRIAFSHADSDHGNAFPALHSRKAMEVMKVHPGEEIWIQGLAPWKLRLLGCRAEALDHSNAGGQVLELFGKDGWRGIFLGDQFGFSLRDLRLRLGPGPVDLLLLPHHGRTTDGLPELLDHLQPRRAWVSCGIGDFPLPVLPLLQRRGIPTQATLLNPLWQAYSE